MVRQGKLPTKIPEVSPANTGSISWLSLELQGFSTDVLNHGHKKQLKQHKTGEKKMNIVKVAVRRNFGILTCKNHVTKI